MEILKDYVDEINIVDIILTYKKELEYLTFIEDNDDQWGVIALKKLPKGFMKYYKSNFTKNQYYYNVTRYNVLSEKFIIKHLKDINSYYLIKHQELSEDFIKEHLTIRNKYIMKLICRYQKLSKTFLLKNYYLIDFDEIELNEKMNGFKYTVFKNKYFIKYDMIKWK